MINSASPVDCFDRSIQEFHHKIRERLPFTYIAYRSLIPEKGDDWYYLAEKVAWVAFIGFQLIEYAASLSLWIAAIPLMPMVMDGAFGLHRAIHHHDWQIPTKLMNVLQSVGFIAFSVLGVAFLFDQFQLTALSGHMSWFHRHFSRI